MSDKPFPIFVRVTDHDGRVLAEGKIPAVPDPTLGVITKDDISCVAHGCGKGWHPDIAQRMMKTIADLRELQSRVSYLRDYVQGEPTGWKTDPLVCLDIMLGKL